VAGAVAVLEQSRAVLQMVASSPTAWRAFAELDAAALARVAAARAAQRRGMWAALAARPGGFPWVEVAGQTWQGWIVLDVDASLIESHSDKEGAAPTYKKHIYGLHPIVVSVANTGEVLAVLLRPRQRRQQHRRRSHHGAAGGDRPTTGPLPAQNHLPRRRSRGNQGEPPRVFWRL
jgi:hypothetical protein